MGKKGDVLPDLVPLLLHLHTLCLQELVTLQRAHTQSKDKHRRECMGCDRKSSAASSKIRHSYNPYRTSNHNIIS